MENHMNYASPATFAYFSQCVCVCESVLMMIQLGLIANLYASRRAAFPARLGCPFFAVISSPLKRLTFSAFYIF